MAIRLIKDEAIPGCGFFEVRFDAGRLSVYFYFEDLPGRLLRPDLVDAKTALEQAKALARAERPRRTSKGNIQLMPKKEILDFKPMWRLAQSGDKRRKQMEDGKHRGA